jgi:hypothetical protein
MNKLMLKSLATALLLATCGCNSTTTIDEVSAFNEKIKSNLPAACNLVATTHDSFQLVSATGLIQPNVVAVEEVAYATTTIICNNPNKVNTASALVTLADAYIAINQAKENVVSPQTVKVFKILLTFFRITTFR